MLTALLSLALMSADSSCARSFDLQIARPEGRIIAGVLERPRSTDERQPTLVLVNGAGAFDRDYPIVLRDVVPAFKILSDRLVCSGYAVFRFDELGTGRSSGDYQRLATTKLLAEDLVGILTALKREPLVDSMQLFLLGHSEGGTIAALAALESRVAGVVMLGTPALRGSQIMKYQHEFLSSAVARRSDVSREARQRELIQEHQERIRNERWYRFFLSFDPLPVYQKLKAPVLVLQGADDWQVQLSQATMIGRVLRKAGNSTVEVVALTGFDHVFFKTAEQVYLPFLAPEVVDTIVGWVSRYANGRASTK